MIQLDEICKTYASRGGTVDALKGVSLKIDDGVAYGVIGLSGAGKSTLIRCVNLLERPTKGRVLIDGRDVTSLKGKPLREMRRNIGMIFQHFNLLEQRNVEGNVRFPFELSRIRAKDCAYRVRELVELVGLSDKLKAYPSELSGGQKQRVAIARALALGPKYLLLDEATSALDPNTTLSILELLKKINRELGVTLIVITHEMSVIRALCDEVAVIEDGKVAESGSVTEVFSFPKSKIARELILPPLALKAEEGGKLRLVFNGESTDEPIVAGIAKDLGVCANILHADISDVGGRQMGNMIVSLPQGRDAEAVKAYLTQKNVAFEEVAG